VSEGGNVIPSDSEAVFYGILDILAKPGFGALLLWGHRNIDLSRLGLHITDPTEAGSVPAGEKRAANAAATNGTSTNGVTNGTTTETPAHTV
jgi:bacteriorhodopsin